ncbi:MAG TPA: hypothetical protein VF311_12285 [Terriglobales bacterium]
MARTFLPLVICEVQLADFSEQKAHTYDKWIYHSSSIASSHFLQIHTR